MGGQRPPLPILSIRYSSQDWLTTLAGNFPLESCPIEFSVTPRASPKLALLYYLSWLYLRLLGAKSSLSSGASLEVCLPSQTISLCPLLLPAALLPFASLEFSSCLLTPPPFLGSWRPHFQDFFGPFLGSSYGSGGAPSCLTATS